MSRERENKNKPWMIELSFYKEYFNRLSISRKISLFFSLVIAAITIFIFIYFPDRRADSAISASINRSKSIAQICSYIVAPSLYFNDDRTLDEELQKFNQLGDLVYVIVTGENDSVKASLYLDKAEKYNYRNQKKAADFDILVVKASIPISLQDKRLGTLYLGLSLADVQAEISSMRKTVGLLSLLILVAGIAAIVRLTRMVVHPLIQIVDTVNTISKGDLDHRAPIVYKDEVGKLAEAFNNMVSNLQTAYNDLENLNKTLERRVNERTKVLQAEVMEHKRTTDALKRSQQELLRQQKIFIGGPTVVFRIKADESKKMEYISSSILQYGFTREELTNVQKSLLLLLHPDDTERVLHELDTISSSDANHFELYFRIKRKDGEIRHMYSYMSLARTQTGELTHYDGYMIDITSTKKAEKALFESESRFRTIFDRAGIGIVLTDGKGNILEANLAFCEMIGYTLNELKQKSFIDITFDVASTTDRENRLREIITGFSDSPLKFEHRYIHKDGRLIWGKLVSSIIRDENGKILFGLGMVEDISEVRRSQQIISRQNRMLNCVAESLRLMLVTPDYRSALEATIRTLGIGMEVDRVYLFENSKADSKKPPHTSLVQEWLRLINNPFMDYDKFKEISLQRLCPSWEDTLAKGMTFKVFGRDYSEPEREFFNLMNRSSILQAAVFVNKQFWGVLGCEDRQTLREWTENDESILKMMAASIGGFIERRLAEQELITAKEKALESDKLKSSLLSNMSHEFRTPLNGVLGYAELLFEALDNDRFKTMAENIKISGDRLMHTLDSILDLSQLESNRLLVFPKEATLASIVEPILKQYRKLAKDKHLSLQYIIHDNHLSVKTDSEQLTKIIRHIIENAIKFTSEGGIVIEIDSIIRQENLLGRIRIADTGIGIAHEQQKLIFDEFRQASEGTGRSYEGSGLGLAIARKLVRIMNGDIELSSQPDKGSTFSILIPAYIPQITEIITKEIIPPAASAPPAGNRKLKILLVEDNDINRQVTELFLEGLYETSHAYTGQAAIEKARHDVYDIILMDIHLGKGMDGIEATHAIRALPNYRFTPIVALTGYSMSGDREKFLENGLTHYLSKPFERSKLLDLIAQIVKEYNF